MKRFLSLILAAVMCVVMAVTVSAETQEVSFPMTINTGVINFSNSTSINTNFAPTIPSDDAIVIKTNSEALVTTKVALVVEGERYTRGYIEKVEYNFTNYKDAACTEKGQGQYWKLGLFANAAYTGDFLVSSFSRIYNITLVTEAYGETDDEQVYYDWGSTTKIFEINPIFTVVTTFVNDTDITDIITELAVTARDFLYSTKEIHFDYPFLPNTDYDDNGIVSRAEVERLSYSKLGEGKGIAGFEGLASQVATFFNKQLNGKITFKVTTAPTTVATAWNNGGIPAYTTGVLAPTTTIVSDNIIGLFFNYETTGSLVALSKIAEDGTITFDISEILGDVGGNTLATFRSIYYGLIGGINYTNYPTKGIKIEQVTLSYEDENGEEIETTIPTITDDDEDEIDPDVDIIVDEPVETVTEEPVTNAPETEPAETVEDVIVVLDDDTTEEVIINTGDVASEDENPHTGVALALIPMLAAGAAVIVSKKRK